jgi:hypothetical protein
MARTMNSKVYRRLFALELVFADAPMLGREGDEDDTGEGEAHAKRRWERANTGCRCVLFRRVESEIVAPLLPPGPS